VDASRQCPASSPQRILLVEDDAAVRRINARVLARSGYQVATAEDGDAGWEALHANHFDLLITDHSMPRLSGLQLVKKVRSARLALPVILVSGSFSASPTVPASARSSATQFTGISSPASKTSSL
jgi:two-component system sensor histidine kinase and response regulator WspE